jgi:hypothetical protein
MTKSQNYITLVPLFSIISRKMSEYSGINQAIRVSD